MAAPPTAAPASSPGTPETSSRVAGPSASAAPADFADFDFANGTRYPEQATASVGPAFYLPGSNVAHVPISLDRPTPNTVI
ncbi:MAG TPA: glycoside hydrolase, partial [Sphingomonas sp.]|nr:glycoside hydrolase [Sphingomonas sp.]